MTPYADGDPFKVGLVGTKSLQSARRVLLRASIARVLRDVAEGLAPLLHLRAQPGGELSRPIVVSELNPGAEHIMAEEGLAAGYDLCALLSSSREEHLGDLDTELLRDAATRLLDRAQEVLEPTGFLMEGGGVGHHMLGVDPAANARMLGMIDLMIVVWDGAPASRSGAVGTNASAAAEQGIPVVWIQSTAPHDVQLYSQTEPHTETWNRLLPPGVSERLQRFKAPKSEGHPTIP